MTTYQQISNWLKLLSSILNFPTEDYVFVEKEQKLIVNDNQTINSITTTTLDGISRDNTVQVTISFESNILNIYVLKSVSIHHLLNNKHLLQQLNVDLSLDKCVFILEESTNEILLTENDLEKSLNNYLLNSKSSIHFRISILIEILKYDTKQQINFPISNRNLTIQQILQLTNTSINIYKYLSSYITNEILSNDEYILKLNQTKFILLKQNEICTSLIKISNDNIQYQKFSIYATISDIYKQNKFNIKQQYFLLYSNDFIPSIDTPLTSFQITSPIQFTIINNNLPITITIINNEDNNLIKFNSSSSLTMKRVYQITYQLFNINNNYYQLMYNECNIDDDDDDITLNDIDSHITNIQFHLISIATIKCSIKYFDQTIILPCKNDTSVLMIIEDIFNKFHISQEDINMYEIFVIDEDQTQVEFDATIKDILQLFPSDIKIIPFELKKIDE